MKNEIVPRTESSIEPRSGYARVVKIGGRVLMVIGALWVLKVGASILLNPLVLLGGAALGAGAYWLARRNGGARDGDGGPDGGPLRESDPDPVDMMSSATRAPTESRVAAVPTRQSAAEQEVRREEALRALKRRIDAESGG